MKHKLKLFFSICSLLVFNYQILYSQIGYTEINDKWFDHIPSTINFSNGDYLVSENGKYRLMRTNGKKNLAIYKKNLFGEWIHDESFFSTDRPENGFHLNINTLTINSFQVEMRSGGIIPFILWHKGFFASSGVNYIKNTLLNLSVQFKAKRSPILAAIKYKIDRKE